MTIIWVKLMALVGQIPLKCTKCGAPLPEPKPGSEYVTCEFCGYTQRVVDAKEYIEKLRGEIFAWIREMLPQQAIISTTADVVARHTLFISYVKPKLLPKFTMIRSKLQALLSRPLLEAPYMPTSSLKPSDPSKTIFEEIAKLQSIDQLAVVDEDRAFYIDVYLTYLAYAYFNVILEILSSKSKISGDVIDFIIRNLNSIIEEYSKYPEKAEEALRPTALLKSYQALQSLFNGDITSAKQLIEDAINTYNKALEKYTTSRSLVIYVPVIKSEFTVAKTIKELISLGSKLMEYGESPVSFMPALSKYIDAIAPYRDKSDIYGELIHYFINTYVAKLGEPTLDIVQGEGDVYVPFWVVKVTYTFTTGALWMKKGRAVEDYGLIIATDPYVRKPYADIFNVKAGFLDRIAGREQTLTNGFVKKILAYSSKASVPSNIKVIPPTCGARRAEEIFNNYIASLGQINPDVGKKLRFGASEAQNIIFIPCRVDQDIYCEILGNSQVSVGPYVSKLMEIAL